MSRNRQKVLVDYFFNNDLKYLQGGISSMTYTTSLTKTKAAQYNLPGIEDMVLNFWVPVKVVDDKTWNLWEISYREKQHKSFLDLKEGGLYTSSLSMSSKDMLLLSVHIGR
ncbi:hypothetical protein Tco_0497370 [Tanacetum coccineum]